MENKLFSHMMRFTLVSLILTLVPIILLSQEQDSSLLKSVKRRKMSPILYLNNSSSFPGNIRVLVNNQSNFKTWMQKSQPDIIFSPTAQESIYEISDLSSDKILMLLDCQWIDFFDIANRKAKEERTIDNSDLSINKITPVHVYFPLITGDGLVASIKEKPFDTTDIDLRGRIVKFDPSTEIPTLHATFMATYIAGAGNSNPKGKGAAWKAQITSSSFSNLLPDDGQKLSNLNVTVQNHSYGVDQIENYYGIETLEYDKQCTDYPNIIHVFSSGNIGMDTSKTGLYVGIPNFANLSGQFKMSKNTISIGATDLYGNIATLSSRGPAYDGRIKPELVAYGDGGTSDAAALVSGICLLVQDAYKQGNNGNMPSSALVKAAIINSADDIGRPGIDFESGYGSIDAYGAVKTIVENRFFNSTITNGEEKIFNISVPTNVGNLKVTLVWTDPEAVINSSIALVNDLDVELFQTSTGTNWKPWVLSHYPNVDSLVLPAKRMKDHLNNVEQVSSSLPENGNYEIRVFGEKIVNGSQNFSLAFEYETGFDWIFPLKSSQIESQKGTQIRWHYAGATTICSLEYQIVGNNTWNIIGNNIDLSQSYYDWITPNSSALAVIRLKTTNEEFLSDTFTISKPMILKVGYNCEDEALISWNPVLEVNEYMVYQLGEKYLNNFTTTKDTFIILDAIDKANYLYAVSPIIKGIEGIRGNTINYASIGVGCYFISFFAKSVVTDTVLFDLNLGSNYKLKSARLERYTNNAFAPIQTIEPVTNLKMTFEDSNPQPNRNLYRICLTRDDQKLIYSDEVEVFFNPVNSLFVYPNPVYSNQVLNVINGDENPVNMNIYDYTGKLLYGYDSNPSAIKVFPIKDIATGIYVLEVITLEGKKLSKQILVVRPK